MHSLSPSQRLLLLAATLSTMTSACFLTYTEAIPCESGEQCPSGFNCDVTIRQCVDREVPDVGTGNGDAGDDSGNNGFLNNVTNNANNGSNNGIVTGPCPGAGMEHIFDNPNVPAFCIDKYEASRPDANRNSAGTDSSRALSRPSVQPWTGVTPAEALSACQASSKRLCTVAEWKGGCGGAADLAYPYANDYIQGICNTFGPTAPTAQYAGCAFEAYNTFDMSGNVAELVDTAGTEAVGGSFMDTDPELLRCNAPPVAASPGELIGFRCCADPL